MSTKQLMPIIIPAILVAVGIVVATLVADQVQPQQAGAVSNTSFGVGGGSPQYPYIGE